MARPERLGFYWIREREGHEWEPAELVNNRGYLEAMVLGYDTGIPIDEIYEWGVEIVPPPHLMRGFREVLGVWRWIEI